MNTSKYSTLTNREFLRQLISKRNVSPIIEELCLRLETELDREIDECPICEGRFEDYCED
jgi:hypothetical protein